MNYPIGVEDIEPEHWVAWVFDLPGCFSKARSRNQAIERAPICISEYFQWLSQHGDPEKSRNSQFSTPVHEEFHSYVVENDYRVNAFFTDDRRPVTKADVKRALLLLNYTRKDLFSTLDGLPGDWLDQPIEGEVQGSIRGILRHVADAEWWYLDRLDFACNWDQLPEDIMERLDLTRQHTHATWPKLVACPLVTERLRESWSVRKTIRRTLWHERAHTWQIQRYREGSFRTQV